MYENVEDEPPDLVDADINEKPPPEPQPKPASPSKAVFNEPIQPSSDAAKSQLDLSKTKKAPDLPMVERRNWLIHQYFLRQDLTACLSLIKEQLDETNGNCEYALFTKGLILRQEGKIQESLELFQMCAKIDPKNVNYAKNLARNLFLLGKIKSALSIFNETTNMTKDDWELYYWRSMCYKNIKDFTNAKESLKHAISTGKREEPFVLLAEIFTDENDIMNAIDCYKKALELSSENADHLATLGLLYLKTDSQEQAFEALGRALGFDPNHAGAILAAGSMMQQHGDYDVALTKYRVAAQQWPDNAQLWSNIGMCFHGKKKFVAAISCLKRANYLAPFDWKILYNLGLVHYEMQQYASAYHFLSSALNVNPRVGQIYLSLAMTLNQLEDFINAEKAYEHALKFDQSNPVIPLNFAIFLNNQGTYDKSKMMLEHYHFRATTYKEHHTGYEKAQREVTEMAERLKVILSK